MKVFKKSGAKMTKVSTKSHNYKSYKRNLRAPERFEKYRKKDFEGASVLDVGCSHGMMLAEAQKAGAKSIIGFDLYGELNEGVVRANLDDWKVWDIVPECDVAMLLAVWKTSRFTYRDSLVIRTAQRARKVLYIETHKHEEPVDYLIPLAYCSDFVGVEFLAYDEDRCLLRLTKDRVDGVTWDYDDEVLEVHNAFNLR